MDHRWQQRAWRISAGVRNWLGSSDRIGLQPVVHQRASLHVVARFPGCSQLKYKTALHELHGVLCITAQVTSFDPAIDAGVEV